MYLFADCPKLIGYTLFFFTYSTFEGRCVFMEDLYVSPQYRAQGIGSRLMKGVAKVGISGRSFDCLLYVASPGRINL